MPSLTLDAELPDEFPKPEAANWFSASRIGHEVELLVGYMDLKRIANILEEQQEHGEGGAVSMPVEVTHRLALGPTGLVNLKQKIDEMYEAMRESGHIETDEGTEAELIE